MNALLCCIFVLIHSSAALKQGEDLGFLLTYAPVSDDCKQITEFLKAALKKLAKDTIVLMLKLIHLGSFLLCTIFANAQEECMEGSIPSKDFNGCIYIITSTHNFPDSEDLCKEQGGHLISVHNAFQNSILTSIIFNDGRDHWIGLRSCDKGWRSYDSEWMDGSDYDYKKWNTGAGEPIKEYALLSPSNGGRWNTDGTFYFDSHPVICLLRFLPPTPVKWTSCPPDWNYYTGTNACYMVGQAKTYFDAQSACRVMESNLASVHSPSENNMIAGYATEYGGKSWLGAQYKNGRYVWEDGTSFSYQPGPIINGTSSHEIDNRALNVSANGGKLYEVPRAIAVFVDRGNTQQFASWTVLNQEETMASFVCKHVLN